jgi:hypothetical protein
LRVFSRLKVTVKTERGEVSLHQDFHEVLHLDRQLAAGDSVQKLNFAYRTTADHYLEAGIEYAFDLFDDLSIR